MLVAVIPLLLIIYLEAQRFKLSLFRRNLSFLLCYCYVMTFYYYLFSIEAMKCGMYCSLFDVMAKTKQGNCLSALLHKMEKEKMVRSSAPPLSPFFLFFKLRLHLLVNGYYKECVGESFIRSIIFKFVRVLLHFLSSADAFISVYFIVFPKVF